MDSPSRLGRIASALVLLLVFLAVGCARDRDPVRPENLPPDTTLEVVGPSEIAGRREVLLRWAGTDPEGALSHFEWRVLASNQNASDTAWEPTDEIEKRLDLAAGHLAERGGELRFEVRAVDVDGLRDASPAAGSFSPRTQAPTVQIAALPLSNSCIAAPSDVRVQWSAEDPDSKLAPAATRYVVLEVGDASTACYTQAQFEADNPFRRVATSDPRWSAWVEYDPDDPLHPSRSVDLEGLDLGHPYLIGVQARDVDGATTRSFEWGENVAHIRITEGAAFLLLEVSEPLLGQKAFVGSNNLESFEVPAGTHLSFEWAAQALSFGAIIDDYRLGVNVQDVDDPDDPGWAVAWGPLQEFDLTLGSTGFQNVVIQTRSSTGAITRVIYELQLTAPKAGR